MSRHILRREKREHHSTLSFDPDIRFDLSAKGTVCFRTAGSPYQKASIQSVNTLRKIRGQVFTKEQIL